jgi:hypothetical protein
MVKRVLDSSPRKPQLYIYASDQIRELAEKGLKTPPLSLSDPVNWSFVQEHLAFLIRRMTYDLLRFGSREKTSTFND